MDRWVPKTTTGDARYGTLKLVFFPQAKQLLYFPRFPTAKAFRLGKKYGNLLSIHETWRQDSSKLWATGAIVIQ